jgi:hypothetical protein
MKLLERFLMGLGTVLLLAISLQLVAPKAVRAVVSTLVTVANTAANPVPTQQAIPTKPFFDRLVLSPGTVFSTGPGPSGTLAVTSIMISNLSTTSGTQEVFITAPIITTGGTCGDAVIGGGGAQMRLLVPQAQTLSVSFPTPVVFSPINGVSCIAAENFVNSPIEVYVTGFVQ